MRAIGAMAFLSACGAGNDGQQASVGTEGGSVALTSGTANGASVSIPRGALASTVTISVRMESASATDLPAAATAAGPVIVFGPEGQRFSTPVTITLPTTSAANTIYTRPVGTTTWNRVEDAQYDAEHHQIVGHVGHFSEFVPALDGRVTVCSTNIDCASPQICLGGQCLTPDTDAGTDAATDASADGGIRDTGTCTPSPEICNGIDDDCDGQPDNGIDCRADAGHACDTGLTDCAGACANLQTDSSNCGACGVSCPSGEACSAGACIARPGCSTDADCAAGQVCVAGACEIGPDAGSGDGGDGGTSDASSDGGTTCAPPAYECSPGACTDLSSDASNCGACGVSCAAGQSCRAGVCVAPTGCSSNLDCPAGEACISGTCEIVPDGGTCTPTTEICNGIDDDCNGLVDDGLTCRDG